MSAQLAGEDDEALLRASARSRDPLLVRVPIAAQAGECRFATSPNISTGCFSMTYPRRGGGSGGLYCELEVGRGAAGMLIDPTAAAEWRPRLDSNQGPSA